MVKLQSVLLIDDDVINNFLNKRLIERLQLNINVTVKENGEEALAYLENCDTSNNFPQLILLDINMPNMNGIEFLQKSHAVRCKSPVISIVLSNTSLFHDIQELNATDQTKIFGVIQKPLTEKKLFKLLRRYFISYKNAA